MLRLDEDTSGAGYCPEPVENPVITAVCRAQEIAEHDLLLYGRPYDEDDQTTHWWEFTVRCPRGLRERVTDWRLK